MPPEQLTDGELIKSTIVKVFLKIDSDLGRDPTFETESSGSTCTLVIILGDRLYCAALGDSEAIMVSRSGSGGSQIDALCGSHRPENETEYSRIVGCGGRVEPLKDRKGNPLGPARIWKKYEQGPGLMTSRSFGDKIAHSVGCITVPEVKMFDLRENVEYIVIGTDGLWEV